MTLSGLGDLRRRGQQMTEELSREGYLAYSGQKPTADLQGIYARFADVVSEESLALTLEAFKSAPDASEEQRSARWLLDWQVESQSSRMLAALDEREIEWEGSAVVTADGEEIQYQAVSIEIGNCPDRRRRSSLDNARAQLAEREHSPIRLERLQREKEITESIGAGRNYNDAFEQVSGVSLSRLAAECSAFLRDTQSLWDDTLPPILKRSLGVKPGEATRADAHYLLRAAQFDGAFPAGAMDRVIRQQMSEMGIDASADGRIVFDVGDRPGKRARAFCSPVRVPEEVYLVLRPHGGQTDYTTYLHELGHALHFANADASYPFEFRWLGDNSVTESYAMLFDHRMQDRRWLLRYTELGKERIAEFMRAAGFEELHFLRRYCAKLLYEVQLYSGDVEWSRLPDLYAESLTAATTFRYRPADAFIDVDPRYYSARYLRAWQLQAIIDSALVAKFDDDWFRNPQAGPWLVAELLSQGQRETAEEIAIRSGAGTLSFGPLIRRIEALLGN